MTPPCVYEWHVTVRDSGAFGDHWQEVCAGNDMRSLVIDNVLADGRRDRQHLTVSRLQTPQWRDQVAFDWLNSHAGTLTVAVVWATVRTTKSAAKHEQAVRQVRKAIHVSHRLSLLRDPQLDAEWTCAAP